MVGVAIHPEARSNPAEQLGVYVDWGNPHGRESSVESFEAWLGRTGLLALDFFPGDTWSNFAATAKWLPGYWWQHNPNRNLVWSIELTLPGTPLSDVAAGLHDADFEAVARQIAWAQPNAIIRPGWEFNGKWFAWAAAGHESDYINAFRRVAQIFRRASPTFSIDWCSNILGTDTPAEQAYPGDDLVDLIGMDIYDKDPSSRTDPEGAWNHYLVADHGLQWHHSFAAAHHKPMSYPEWGIGREGDNPYFVQQMVAWIKNNHIAYNIYWNTNSSYPGMISNHQYVKSAEIFREQFGP
jgi:hypothetical protein